MHEKKLTAIGDGTVIRAIGPASGLQYFPRIKGVPEQRTIIYACDWTVEQLETVLVDMWKRVGLASAALPNREALKDALWTACRGALDDTIMDAVGDDLMDRILAVFEEAAK